MAMTVGIQSQSNMINSTNTPATVSASVGSDGASVDAATSKASGTYSGKAATATKASAGLQKDDFLKLLMTQLQNQDPLSPMDNSQMMTQMAQLQSIESSNNIQKAVEDMDNSFKSSTTAQQSSAQSMVNATSVSLIGKKVTVKQDSVAWSGNANDSVSIRVNLSNNDGAQVQILDDKGGVIKTLQTGAKDLQNSSTVTWDGKLDAGGYAQPGTYSINIVGQDKDSSLYAYVSDTVQGVRFSNDGAKLSIAGKELTVANVMNVEPEAGANGFDTIAPSTAISLIGKKVRVQQPTVKFGNGNMETVPITVNATPFSNVAVSLTDSNGIVVAQMTGQADQNGIAAFQWNGETLSGSYADSGSYSVNVAGSDVNPSLYSYSEGTIDGISTSGGATQLRMNGATVPLSRIIDISSGS